MVIIQISTLYLVLLDRNIFHPFKQDARVAVKACEGLMLCVSLPEQNSAKCIVENTELSTELTRMLCDLYEKLPKAMDPADIECVEANWGLVYMMMYYMFMVSVLR